MMEGVNSTMIYCKNFCKCHNVPPIQQQQQQQRIIKKLIILKGQYLQIKILS
jgi:hypothetical protein